MSIDLNTLVDFCDQKLQVRRIEDYCPNGLQVEGCSQVSRIVTGVTASQALIDKAIGVGANAIIVHHGYFWKGEPSPITGIKKRRLAELIKNDISLLAYHLPLDMHEELGNNVQLAKLMGWTPEPAKDHRGLPPMVRTAVLEESISGDDLKNMLEEKLQREPMYIDGMCGSQKENSNQIKGQIKKVAWCTGAAQSYLHKAISLGADAYITGEISEQTVHEARENNIYFYAAGHHATERYGVKALGAVLAAQFGIDCEFIDCDNPV